MIKYGFLAAGLALATGAPAFAQQMPPTPLQPPPAVMTPSSTSTTIVVAPTAPPAPRVETPPPMPAGPHLVWKPGHWRWGEAEAQYVWVPGSYVQPPTVVATWTPGHWVRRPGGWAWIDGHW